MNIRVPNTLKTDHPILRELWEIRDGLLRECGHDLRRLFGKRKAFEKSYPAPIVNRIKRRVPPAPGR